MPAGCISSTVIIGRKLNRISISERWKTRVPTNYFRPLSRKIASASLWEESVAQLASLTWRAVERQLDDAVSCWSCLSAAGSPGIPVNCLFLCKFMYGEFAWPAVDTTWWLVVQHTCSRWPMFPRCVRLPKSMSEGQVHWARQSGSNALAEVSSFPLRAAVPLSANMALVWIILI